MTEKSRSSDVCAETSHVPPAFFSAAAVLFTPVTVQQVAAFSPEKLTDLTSHVMPDGSDYFGEMLLDKPHGLGIMIFKSTSHMHGSGDRYGGEWVNGVFHGSGVLITSGFTYEGSFERGKIHGRGKVTYSSSVTNAVLRGIAAISPFEQTHKPFEYTGEFHHTYHRHGRGVMLYANGDVYDGEWAMNYRNGKGTMKSGNGLEVYEGEWYNDERHGSGKITYEDGGKFSGTMMHDKRHGEGNMLFPNGDEYNGNFISDKINGHGTMRYKNGDVYEGLWRNGLRHGEGKYTLRKQGATVKGFFCKGLIQGRGVVEYPGISTFVGEFDRGERKQGTMFWHETNSEERLCYQGEWIGETCQGRGLLWYQNGDFYFGRFSKNKRHGPGNMRYADGAEFSGNYLNDLRDGMGILQRKDGTIQAGVWRNDTLIEGYDGEWDGVTLNGIGHLVLREVLLGSRKRGSNSEQSGNTGVSASAQTPAPHASNGSETDSAEKLMPPPLEHFGLFRNGLRHGAGVLRLLGHVVMGHWVEDLLSCDSGSWEFPSGDLYVGSFQSGLRHGSTGRMWFSDGSYFSGRWEQDVPVGNGILYGTKEKSANNMPQNTSDDNMSLNNTVSAANTDDDVVGDGKSSFIGIALLVSMFFGKTSGRQKQVSTVAASREHYLLQNEWAASLMSYAKCQSLLLKQSAAAKRGGCATTKRAKNALNTVCKRTLVSSPDAVPVGTQSGHGIAFFKSGLRVSSDWLNNHPQLVLPHHRDAPLRDKMYKNYPDDESAGADGANASTHSSSISKVCLACSRVFAFYRKTVACALCERSYCGSCLRPIERSEYPRVESLLHMRSVVSGGITEGDSTSASQLMVCEECHQAVLLELQYRTFWLPMRRQGVVPSELDTVEPDSVAAEGDQKEESKKAF
ncbi:putative MORN repeat [Trypanosoma vivax]|nr:putative MORN repeat [Trypanosoma vivax]